MLGSTGVVDTEIMWQLLAWVKKESKKKAISVNEQLNDLRAKMNAQVFEKS